MWSFCDWLLSLSMMFSRLSYHRSHGLEFHSFLLLNITLVGYIRSCYHILLTTLSILLWTFVCKFLREPFHFSWVWAWNGIPMSYVTLLQILNCPAVSQSGCTILHFHLQHMSLNLSTISSELIDLYFDYSHLSWNVVILYWDFDLHFPDS